MPSENVIAATVGNRVRSARTVITLVLFALAPHVSFAQPPTGNVRAGGVANGLAGNGFPSIAGIVTAGDSKAPLKKASVILTPVNSPAPAIPRYTTTTGEDGRYILKDIEPGRYQFWVSRNGYVREEYGAKRPGRAGTSLNLNSGQQLSEVNFTLMRQAVVTGRVVDEDGEPAPRATVQALRASWIRGRKQLVAAGSAQTDDRGQYRIHDLAPGKYLISANYRGDWARSLVAARADVEQSYVTTYYPGTNDAATAALLDIAAGSETQGVDIRVLKLPTVRIRGSVVSQNGSIRHHRVTLLPSGTSLLSPTALRTAETDRNWVFEFRGVAPGAYILSVDSDSADAQGQSGRVRLDVGNSPVDGITLPVASGTLLKGRVKMEADAQLPLHKVHVSLKSRDNPFFGGTATATIDDDGSFAIPALQGEMLDVTLQGMPPGYYLKSVRSGDQEILTSGLNAASGVAAALELVVSPNAGKAEGVVLDDQQRPVSGAIVVIAPDTTELTRPELFKNAATDQTGHYVIENVPPGKYRIFAFEDLDAGAAQDSEFLKQFEQKSEKADFEEKSTISKQLALIRMD